MKLFVFDIDNTLISHHNGDAVVVESAKEALQIIKDNGCKPILATGRPYNTVEHIMDDLDISDAILSNGSTVVLNKEIIYNRPIIEEANASLLKAIKEKGLPAIAMDSHDIYIYSEVEEKGYFDKLIEKFISPMFEGTTAKMKEFDFDSEYNIISIFSEEEIDTHNEIEKTWYHNTGYELTNKGSSKATGILKYIEENNIDKNDVYVFGDNYNDLSMFAEFYENSYVLGNACDEVKSYAKHICDHIDNDGIYKAIVSIFK